MALEANIQFRTGPLPVRDDGALALVKLSSEAMAARSIEYYGDPVVVSRWSGKLKTTSKVSGQNGFIFEAGETPLNGYRAGVTNQVPSNLTKGTANGICSALIFGNWADLVIGQWGALDIMVDPYTGSASGTVRVVALQDADIAVRNAASFAAMKDALTT